MTNTVSQIKDLGWWDRRSAVEQILMFISAVSVLAVVALMVSLLTVAFTLGNPVKDANDVCNTPGCIYSASKAVQLMDLNVEPCDDFYRYACGRYINETIIPDEKVSVDTFTATNDRLQQQLRSLISEEISESDAAPFKLAKNLYKLCMNKTRIEEKGIEPLLSILDTLGGWPILKGDSWDSEPSWSWEKSVKDFNDNGFNTDYIIDFSIAGDLKDTTRRMIDIDQSVLGLPREYLVKGINDPIVSAYYDYMVDLAVLLGADKARAKLELLESLNFEMTLANISLPREERRNATALYNPMTVKEFQQRYPHTEWVDYFNALLISSGIVIDENEVINLCVPTFMEQLGPLLRNTPKRVMANYMMWRISWLSSYFLTENLRKRDLEFTKVVNGKQEEQPRWKECIDVTSGRLPIAVSALYIRKYFREESKRAALDMVNDIKSEFVNILKKVDWMDDVTRESALEKVSTMVNHIGYPDELMDDGKIAEYYKNLEFQPSSTYLNAILLTFKFDTTTENKRLRLPVNKTDWVDHSKSAVVNAYYNSIENSIQFPAGILQGKFFSHDRPKYLNYGAIGYIIGHEITHGFDDQGRQFDKDGNLVDWWQADTKKAYLEKARCIIEQYGNYTEPNVKLNLNGINTQGENIADNGGIKEAYYAYRQWAAKNEPEKPLPFLKLSPEQLFWLSAAQTWCNLYRPETMKNHITTSSHSPGQFRVLGPMRNMKEFAKDFNCVSGSKMNPVEKCEVW